MGQLCSNALQTLGVGFETYSCLEKGDFPGALESGKKTLESGKKTLESGKKTLDGLFPTSVTGNKPKAKNTSSTLVPSRSSGVSGNNLNYSV